MLPPEQIEVARNMRGNKTPWEMIAEHFGVTVYYLRGALDPHWKQYRLANTRKHRVIMRERKTTPRVSYVTHHIVDHTICPNDILMERDRRQAIEYPDFTSQFMGDPKPGFSALDKKQRAFG